MTTAAFFFGLVIGLVTMLLWHLIKLYEVEFHHSLQISSKKNNENLEVYRELNRTFRNIRGRYEIKKHNIPELDGIKLIVIPNEESNSKIEIVFDDDKFNDDLKTKSFNNFSKCLLHRKGIKIALKKKYNT